MKKISILYSWFIRSLFILFPDHPYLMRLRGFMYSFLMKSCGKNLQISSSVIIKPLSNLEFGDNVYIAPNTVIFAEYLKIEDDVIIGPNCLISGGNHCFDGFSFRNKPSTSSKVLIEAGSWVGGNSTILSGAILPKQSILAAGSVLSNKYSKKFCVYGGVPAKKIKIIKL